MRIPKFMIVAAAACLGLGMITGAATAAPPAKSLTVSYISFDVGDKIDGAVDTNVTGTTATATTPGLVVGTYRVSDLSGEPTATRVGFIAHTGMNFAITSLETVRQFDSTDVNITSVNSSGTTSGYYLDDALVEHGFLRAANGDMTWLDAPDAKGLPLSSWMFEGVPFLHDTFKGGTFPSKVTDAGLVVGFYSVAIPDVDPTIDPQILLYGFIRTPADAWTTIDVGEQSGTTQLFGMNASGTLEGSALFRSDRKDADDWTVKGFTASTATRKGIPTFVRVTNTFVYPSPPAPDPLPTNFCGWTTVMAMNDAATLMAGNAGNGCSINPYSWVWMKKDAQPFAALLYTEPGASEPAATQTFVSGLSPTGLVLGTWVDWQNAEGPGDVLSPYDPRGYGLWHGYIATVT